MNRLKLTYKNIIFDLDGTLTDSAPGIKKSLAYALAKYNIKATDGELTQMIGPPLKTSFKDIYGFSEEKTEEAIWHYREYFRVKGVFDNSLYPGIKDMLTELKEDGRRLFIATTKAKVFAEQVLKYFSIDHFFRQVAGSNLDGSNSSKDILIGSILSHSSDLAQPETVMVGDRKFDILGAKTHNLDSIAVLYGYGTLEELEGLEPTALASSVAALRALLLKNN